MEDESPDAVRLRAALSELQLGPNALARVLGRDKRLVERWLTGQRAVPPEVWADLARIRRADLDTGRPSPYATGLQRKREYERRLAEALKPSGRENEK